MALKSADHVAAILDVINNEDWARAFIWDYHKDDKSYDEVAVPDRVRSLGGGMVMIETGRTALVENGKMLYASEEDFWKTVPRHWPRLPFKPTHWKRDYRRKEDGAIVRRFDLFIHAIYAITREIDGKLVSIQFYGQASHWLREDGPRPQILLREVTFETGENAS